MEAVRGRDDRAPKAYFWEQFLSFTGGCDTMTIQET
jgi:hypothetical protein